MKFFTDISALHHTLRVAYEQVPAEKRQDFILEGLQGWGVSQEQARLCASNLLTQDVEGSADFTRTNACNVLGSWVRGEQQDIATAWLKTMKETWKFNDNLTYEHNVETYEGYSTGPSPYFQSAYSRPSTNSEWCLGTAGHGHRSVQIIYDDVQRVCSLHGLRMDRQSNLLPQSVLHRWEQIHS